MGNKVNTTNNTVKEKINQIFEYYLFQKRLEYILNGKDNPLIIQKNIINKNVFNFFGINEMKHDYYIVDKKWIESWKKYTNYEKAKSYFDEINIENKNQLEKEIIDRCNNMALTEEINDSKDNYPGKMEKKLEGVKSLSELFLNLNNLDYLINRNFYSKFSNTLEKLKLNTEENKYVIQGIIKDKMMILIFENEFIVKFIYFNNGVIGLTANFCLKGDCSEEQKKKYKDNLNYFLSNEVMKRTYEEWIEFFNKNNIFNNIQVTISDNNGEDYYILKKDNLILKNGQQNLNFNYNFNQQFLMNNNPYPLLNNFNQMNPMFNNQMNNFNFNYNMNGVNYMNNMYNNINPMNYNNQFNLQNNQINNYNMMNNQMNMNNIQYNMNMNQTINNYNNNNIKK